MSDERDQSEGRAVLAAEYALGLLTGDDRLEAERLASSDPDFAREAARWRGRLAPMIGEVDETAPPATVWQRIAAATGEGSQSSNVILLQRRVRAWRGAAAAMTALAASLAVFLVMEPRPAPVPTPAPHAKKAPAAPLVAMLGNEQSQTKVVASWNPATRQLVLAVAGAMPADPNHSHELWVIPSDGKPRSLGTMGGAKATHKQIADAVADLLTQGATIAISVEPPGGSPSGAPTGPVVASGALSRA